MDVNVTLATIRELTESVEGLSAAIDRRLDDLQSAGMDSADTRETAIGDLEHDLRLAALSLAMHVSSMDEWLRKGGFLPAAWVAPKSL